MLVLVVVMRETLSSKQLRIAERRVSFAHGPVLRVREAGRLGHRAAGRSRQGYGMATGHGAGALAVSSWSAAETPAASCRYIRGIKTKRPPIVSRGRPCDLDGLSNRRVAVARPIKSEITARVKNT